MSDSIQKKNCTFINKNEKTRKKKKQMKPENWQIVLKLKQNDQSDTHRSTRDE